MKKRIIISGGGIAGLTAAKLLHAQGHEVIVNDRALQFTKAGFLLSLKSFGVKIMEEIGLKNAIIAESTPSEWMNFMDREGGLIRSINYDLVNQHTERQILITRGALHDVIYQSLLADGVHVRLGTTIGEAIQTPNKVEVTYSNGEKVEADLLLVTEGVHSASRSVYFQEAEIEDFNVFYLGGKVEGKHKLPMGRFKIFIDVNRMLSIYPITDSELAIQCYVHSNEDVEKLSGHAGKLLSEAFSGYPEEELIIIDHLLDRGLVFADKMAITHVSNFVNNRIVLLGDAAYCPTAFSGMGASLSIYGAKALAHFLLTEETLDKALINYNEVMQPVAQKFQDNARKNAAQFLPDRQEVVDQFKAFFQQASEDVITARFTDQLELSEDQLKFRVPK